MANHIALDPIYPSRRQYDAHITAYMWQLVRKAWAQDECMRILAKRA